MYNLLSDKSRFSTRLRAQIPFYVVLLTGFMLAACDSNDSGTSAPTASFASSEQEVNEGAITQLIVQLNEPFDEDVSIPFNVTSTADLAGYVITPSPLTIYADSITAVIEVSSLDDNVPEASDTIFVTLEEPANAMIGDPQMFRLTILDND